VFEGFAAGGGSCGVEGTAGLDGYLRVVRGHGGRHR
jgi:hypothetical protein